MQSLQEHNINRLFALLDQYNPNVIRNIMIFKLFLLGLCLMLFSGGLFFKAMGIVLFLELFRGLNFRFNIEDHKFKLNLNFFDRTNYIAFLFLTIPKNQKIQFIHRLYDQGFLNKEQFDYLTDFNINQISFYQKEKERRISILLSLLILKNLNLQG